MKHESRFLDRGNADLPSLQRDFRRLGIDGVNGRLAAGNPLWMDLARRRGDRAFYGDLIELRNALAHGNQGQGAVGPATGGRCRDRRDLGGSSPTCARAAGLAEDDGAEPVTLLLAPSVLTAA